MKVTKSEKVLQKFKDDPTGGRIDNLLLKILKASKLKKEDVFTLTDKQRRKAAEILTGGLLALNHEDRDVFIDKVEDVLSEESRRELWERNHSVIIGSIDWLMRQKNRMPTPTEISDQTGLSRQTIYSHLKAYAGSEEQKEKQDTIAVLREKIKAKMYSLAMDGDVRAARVFLDSTEVKEPKRITKQENNYLQFNNLVITREQLNILPPVSRKRFIKSFKK